MLLQVGVYFYGDRLYSNYPNGFPLGTYGNVSAFLRAVDGIQSPDSVKIDSIPQLQNSLSQTFLRE